MRILKNIWLFTVTFIITLILIAPGALVMLVMIPVMAVQQSTQIENDDKEEQTSKEDTEVQ